MALDYRIVVEPLAAEDGGGFIARVPELPGCFSDGETPTEAVENALDAIRAWIEMAEEMGRPVPKPMTREERLARYRRFKKEQAALGRYRSSQQLPWRKRVVRRGRRGQAVIMHRAARDRA